MFTKADVEDLKIEYDHAVNALADVIVPKRGTINYPPNIVEFMAKLLTPVWSNPSYDPGETQHYINHLESADDIAIRSILTHINIVERFSDGMWIDVLKQGLVERVLERAEQIAR
ncbi:DUF6508 domain-containing protein [Echinimonas agarilytica]|uniref:DUF6508 domain-containing protein n=1 Tax=Echinimonas agarilytica TaxID=1215918 RepID=A0AA41WAD2_9GAMM|nr:DUF6508 domain-containing protein [Echinimonas agarilytica]MCM2681242.1 DUF6508 domain-containing protein [Echinimonas agarilytica]